MPETIITTEPTRAREILDALKQQREEISHRAFVAFASNSCNNSSSSNSNSSTTLNQKTVWTNSTSPTYEVHVVMPAKQKKSKKVAVADTQQPSSPSRSHELHEVVKERRENLLDMLKAASSCRTINSHQGSARSSATGRTDELSSMSPEDNHTSNSSETSDACWAIVSPTPSLEAKGTASFTDESSSSSTGDDSRHHVILLPEFSEALSRSTSSSPEPTPESITQPTKRWTREEFCLPRELCWSMMATALAPNPVNGPRPKSKISLRGRYISPAQVVAKRMGLGQHRLRKGSVVRKRNDQVTNSASSKKSNKNKPPVVVVFHNEIVDDHEKRNMMLRSMMLDVIFLRRQYAQVDAKRAAAAKQAAAANKYGLWGPYAKCFLSDDVSLACTSDSDTSGWFTDDDSTAAGTYGVEYSVAKKWVANAPTAANGTVKKNNKPSFTPPTAVTTRAMSSYAPESNNYALAAILSLPSVEEEEEDDDDEWIMPEDMSDQLCGAYGGMYFLYKKQRRVRLSTFVEV